MHRPLAAWLAISLALASHLTATSRTFAAEARTAVPADGPPFKATVAKIDDPWKISFEKRDGELPAADLVSWGAFVDAVRGPQLLLAGGGLLVADVLEITKEHLKAEANGRPPLFGAVQLPLEAVVGIVLRPPTDRARRDQLIAKTLAVSGDSDRLLLDNGDELAGTVAGMHGEFVTLEAETGKVEIELSKVLAIVFNPALREKPRSGGLRAWVGFSDGSRVLASSLTMNQKTAQIKLTTGQELRVRSDLVVALQPVGGRALYLSDLKEAGYRHVPYLELSWPYKRDENVSGTALRAGGKLFVKGLGMHSASRLTYDLSKPYRRFQAEACIDDQTQGAGSVIFRVFTDDGSGKWQAKFTSPIVRGGDPPLPISVDLTGAKRISLLVEFADHGDEQDHADWLNARLIK